jgi:hypothetical protein
MLWRNRLAIHPGYALRAGFITLSSLGNSAQARRERATHAAGIDKVAIAPPVFILGHWRSGTTFLHELLACDSRLAWPSMHSTLYPHTFLTSEEPVRWGKRILTPTRLIDNMPLGFDRPHEDEFALCLMSLRSPYVGWAFPRHHAQFERYLTFDGVPPEETDEWRQALLLLARKLSVQQGARPIVFKSPTHTARIRILLEMFPGARFVHIHREPFRLFESTRAMVRTATSLMALQPLAERDVKPRVLRVHEAMYRSFFAERALVPQGRLHEMAYEDLERDPMAEMRRLYAALSLPDFAETEPALRPHVAGLEGYRKNTHPGLDEGTRGEVAERWRPYFEEWGYPRH